jgi:HEAT repeats
LLKGQQKIRILGNWQGRITDAISEIGYDQIRKALQAGADKQSGYCPSRTTIPFDRSLSPLLDSLLSSQNLDLRRAAAHALRGICDPSSARVLARALDNSDRDVQYDAMMGLAALEHFPTYRPAPARSLFNESPAKYLDAWKNWWTTTGKQKYSKSHLT